jgi:hypothetical protein
VLALESGLTGNVPQVNPADFFDTTLQGLIPFEQAQPFLQAPQDFGLAQSADVVWPDFIQRPSDEAPPTWNIPFTTAEQGIQKTGTTTTIADAVLKLTGEPLTFTQKLALGDAANAAINLTQPLVQQLNAIGAGDHVDEILEALQPLGTPEEIQWAAIVANLPTNYFPPGAGTPYLSGTTIEDALSGGLPPITASDIAAAVSDFESTFAQMRPSAADIAAALAQLDRPSDDEIAAAARDFESTYTPVTPEAIAAALAEFQGGFGGGAANQQQQNMHYGYMLNGMGIPANMQTPDVLNAISSMSQATGLSPVTIAGIIEEENPAWSLGLTNQFGFRGLLQQGNYAEVPWYSQLPSMTAAEQIGIYSQWLGNYNVQQKIQQAGINLQQMSPVQQMALMEGIQLGPNNTAFYRNVAAAMQGVPGAGNVRATTSAQAGNLGTTSFNDMVRGFQRMYNAHSPTFAPGTLP